jgi:predicted nucleic acid-binding protein
MIIYLDNCCFNRPFDDQRHLRIRLEAEAKLRVQEVIRAGGLQLAWSYVLDFENASNPFVDRREGTRAWRTHAAVDCVESPAVKSAADAFAQIGLRNIDALHLACAVQSGCAYFITTDDRILAKAERISQIQVTDPIGFIKKELP